MSITIENDIIGNISVGNAHPFHNGMPSPLNFNCVPVIYPGTTIIIFFCRFSQRHQHIEISQHGSRSLNASYLGSNPITNVDKKLVFPIFSFILSIQHRIFVFFQLLVYVAFRIDKGLFPYIIVRNQIGICFCYSNIVPKHAVVSDFECINSRPLTFLRLQGSNPLFTVSAC